MLDESEMFFITAEEAGERLDKILAERLKKIGSRTYFQFLIEEGKVLLNGAPVKKRIKPSYGDEVEIEYILNEEISLLPEEIPLDVVYEDPYLLVVNKPPGMVVHPATGHWTGTFVNALLFHCQTNFTAITEPAAPNQALRPGIVHRLDKDTSGLLLAAKTPLAQQKLIEMFSGRRIHKEYLAICVGNPGTGTVNAPIGRHPIKRQMMTVTETGREAITHYKTLTYDERLSVVSVVIATGRTHQIRVHMKHQGFPVLGDAVYGSSSANEKQHALRQMLHAQRLKFTHPITGVAMELEAPIPKDMQSYIKKM